MYNKYLIFPCVGICPGGAGVRKAIVRGGRASIIGSRHLDTQVVATIAFEQVNPGWRVLMINRISIP
jgi:hypothetical protein